MSTQRAYRALDVAVRGGDLRVGVWEAEGEPTGTLLAVHGITASHLSWTWLADALPSWRIVAPDLRGRGRSNRLPGPYGMVTHAEDLAAVLGQLELGPVPVVGHSMGGFAAVVLADRHPDLVSRLVLVDGGLPIQRPDGVTPEAAAGALLGPAAERLSQTFPSVEAYQGFWQQHPALADAWGPELAAYAAYDLDGDEPELRPATRYEAMAEDSLDIQIGATVLPALAELQHPAVFLRAQRGLLNEPPAFYTAEWVAHWADNMPQLTALEATDTNHYTVIMTPRGVRQVAAVVT